MRSILDGWDWGGEDQDAEAGRAAREIDELGAMTRQRLDRLGEEFESDPQGKTWALLQKMPKGWGVGNGREGWFVACGRDILVDGQPDLVALFRALIQRQREEILDMVGAARLYAAIKALAGDTRLN